MVGIAQPVPLSQENRPLDVSHLALRLRHGRHRLLHVESLHLVSSWDTELYEARHNFVWRMGEGVVELLDPQPGERILDLGCGPGQLTNKISESGAQVVGLDASPSMLGQARQNFPNLRFVLQNAASITFNNEFDAVFSNAALHWMLDPVAVVRAVSKALKPGGRFVAEMGGKGNIQTIVSAIHSVVSKYGPLPPSRQYYPSISEYTSILEAHALEVRQAQLFDRPTPLDGDSGMANWIKQFKSYYFENIPASALSEVIAILRPKLFDKDVWLADYRRLRFLAVKL